VGGSCPLLSTLYHVTIVWAGFELMMLQGIVTSLPYVIPYAVLGIETCGWAEKYDTHH
jgi:hypothetical protein